MPELPRPKTPDENAVLVALIALGDELAPSERRFVDGVVGEFRYITDTEALAIANLMARVAARRERS